MSSLCARCVCGVIQRHTGRQRQVFQQHRLLLKPVRATTRSVRPARISAQKSDGHAGHAMLHDFCMTIPYGGIALVSGLVAFVFKATTAGMQLSGAGAVISLCSVLSLKTWKTGGSSMPYTLLSGGVSGWIAYQMWQRVAASIAPVPSGILLALSAALATFCLYNVVAGGNPPPAEKQA